MTVCNDYQFPLYVYDLAADPDFFPEPFSYVIRTEHRDNATFLRTACYDIPCEVCIFTTDCKKGINRTETLGALLKEKFPELLI